MCASLKSWWIGLCLIKARTFFKPPNISWHTGHFSALQISKVYIFFQWLIGHWTVISGIVVTAELNRRNDNQAKSGHSWYWGGDTFGADWVIVALELDQTNQHYHQIFDKQNKGMAGNQYCNQSVYEQNKGMDDFSNISSKF